MDKKSTDFIQRAQTRNFWVFAIHFILVRIGWLFKTESVIISSFVRGLTESSMIIGLFPMISRLGQTLPQLFMAAAIQHVSRKKQALLISFSLYFIVWFAIFLLLLFVPYDKKTLILVCFFILYTIFWLNNGCYQVLVNIVRGKLIAVETRGRLISVSGFIGGLGALIVAVYMVRPLLITPHDFSIRPYTLIFLLAGVFFLGAWIILFWLQEPALAHGHAKKSVKHFLVDALALVWHDRNFILFFSVGTLITIGYGLIYFYTVFSCNELHTPLSMLANYLVVQVVANMLGSYVYGRMADAVGNKRVLIIIMILVALTPLTAVLVITAPNVPYRIWLFSAVYFLIGFNLPVHQILINYLLEIAPLDKHPHYLGVYNALRTVVFIFPPLTGLCIDIFGFVPVFFALSLLLSGGIILSLRLIEPRVHQKNDMLKRIVPLG